MAPAATGDLAIAVLQRNAAEFLEHTRGARAGTDPHHVHQMRVATRRMRAALRLFADVLPPAAKQLNDELKWFAGQLGPVRDLDVQLQRLRTTSEALGVVQPVSPYMSWMEEQHTRARAKLAEAFESRRFGSLVQHLQRLGGWPIADSPSVSVEAPRRLRHAFRQVRKRADAADDQSPAAELHAIRIRAKRLRYAAEFFQPTYGKPARRLAERVVTLQDLLGNLQDGVVSRQHIRQAARASGDAWPAQTAMALGQLLQFEAEREHEFRTNFRAAYHRVQESWKRVRHEVPKTAS